MISRYRTGTCLLASPKNKRLECLIAWELERAKVLVRWKAKFRKRWRISSLGRFNLIDDGDGLEGDEEGGLDDVGGNVYPLK
jgi:hypothetical protein